MGSDPVLEIADADAEGEDSESFTADDDDDDDLEGGLVLVGTEVGCLTDRNVLERSLVILRSILG